jgi:4'-phosphopantetheinyl transferase
MSPAVRTVVEVGGVPVSVWLADCEPDVGGLLTAGDLAGIEAIAVPAARAQAARGRAVLRWVLGECLGLPPTEIALVRTNEGRPYLAGSDWDFSLSQAPGMVVVAVVCGGLRVGVDVERIRRLDRPDTIAARMFAAADRSALAVLSGTERDVRWFQAWTRLEALAKARGTGIFGAVSGAADGCGGEPSYAELPLPAGYAGAVVVLPGAGPHE